MYKIGYIAGVFDLFHIGHLNLIRNAKRMCKYLIVGVLTDELVIHFKKNPPIIPFEERLDIVSSIRDVDKAIGVGAGLIDKMAAWEELHFDCLFSGDDYKDTPSWLRDRELLRKVGSNIHFFSYTQSTSSTKIKRILNTEDSRKDRVFIYGAGQYGKKALEYYGSEGVLGFIDRDPYKIGTMLLGKPVYDIQKIGAALTKEDTIMIALKQGKEEAAKELRQATQAACRYFM